MHWYDSDTKPCYCLFSLSESNLLEAAIVLEEFCKVRETFTEPIVICIFLSMHNECQLTQTFYFGHHFNLGI